MPTTQPSPPPNNEAAGIEQAIQSVEGLYRAVTGKEPPAGEGAYTPIPVEKNPTQFVEEQLDQLLALLERRIGGFARPLWHPLLAVVEDDAELCVQVDLPGVDRRDVEVSLEGNVLSVRGRRGSTGSISAEGGKRMRLDERPSGGFSRQVLLSPSVRLGEPRAQLKDGVLEIRFAKESPAEAGAKAVPVN